VLELARKRDIQEVALAVGISWLPLVLGSQYHVAYAAFAILFIARFAFQPRDGALPTLPRRVFLIGLAWSAFACFAWPLLALLRRLGS
jgi:hypothetical protein